MNPDRRVEDRYDYDGSCRPGAWTWASQKKFSVAIFQWRKKVGGGLKRGKAVYRVHGWVSDPKSVYRRAEEVCVLLESGGALEKKGESVP